MDEVEFHKKVKEFFKSIGVNNIKIDFDPDYREIFLAGKNPLKTEYIRHNIQISASVRFDQDGD